MEDEVDRLGAGLALLDDVLLRIAQDRRLQLDVAGRVDAVRVAERGRDREVADRVQRVVRLQHVFGLRVEPRVIGAGVVDAVFLAARDAELDLQRHVHLRDARQRAPADLEVLVQRLLRQIQHVRAEQRLAVLGEVLLARGDHALHPGQQLLRAVIGVQHRRHAVHLRHRPHVQRARDRTRDRRLLLAVVQRLAREELRAGVRQLDDDRRLRLLRGGERGVGRARSDDVHRGKRAVDFLAVSEELLEGVTGDDSRGKLEVRHGVALAAQYSPDSPPTVATDFGRGRRPSLSPPAGRTGGSAPGPSRRGSSGRSASADRTRGASTRPAPACSVLGAARCRGPTRPPGRRGRRAGGRRASRRAVVQRVQRRRPDQHQREPRAIVGGHLGVRLHGKPRADHRPPVRHRVRELAAGRDRVGRAVRAVDVDVRALPRHALAEQARERPCTAGGGGAAALGAPDRA